MRSNYIKPRTRAEAAFSLLEIAIVLGVIGLVVGGIWAAAAKVREANKLDRTRIVMLQTIRKMQNLYGGNDFPASAGQQISRVPEMIAAGAIPPDFVLTPTIAQHPWQGSFIAYQGSWNGGVFTGSNYERFAITLHGLPYRVCNQLIPLVTGSFHDQSDLYAVYSGGSFGNITITSFPTPLGAYSCPYDPATGLTPYISFFFNSTPGH